MIYLLIYLFVMVENFAGAFATAQTAFVSIGVGLVIAWCVGTIAVSIRNYDDKAAATQKGEEFTPPPTPRLESISKWIKRSMWAVSIFFVLGSLLPSEKQMGIIVGSSVAYSVFTSDPAQRIGGKALDLLEQKIDNALKDEVVQKVLPSVPTPAPALPKTEKTVQGTGV